MAFRIFNAIHFSSDFLNGYLVVANFNRFTHKSINNGKIFERNIMKGKNLCTVLHGKNDIRMEEREIPTPKPNQVLVRINTVGICGTDVHYWQHATLGPYTLKKPMVLGHESSGIVAGLGSEVKGFKIGDRIALEPGVPCRICEHCKTGKYNMCEEIRFFANPPDDGALARYVAHDADFCYKIADNMTMEDGALLEPLSVAVHATRRANVTIGQKILVLGAGPVGLVNLLTAKAMGASKVLITDVVNSRLQMAKDIGADEILNVGGMKQSEIVEEVLKRLGGRPDAALECAGVASSLETAVLAVKSRGAVVAIGLGAERVELPIVDAAIREVDILGVFRYTNTWPTAIEMVSSGKVNLKGLTRAHFKLEQSKEAFNKFLKGDVVKVFIHCDDSE